MRGTKHGGVKKCAEQYSIGINMKKYQYEVVIAQMSLYGAEALGLRRAKRMNVNVLEINYLRSSYRSVMNG